MANSERVRSILIADPDSTYVEMLKKDSKARRFPIIVAQTGADAQLIIANQEHALVGIFLNPAIDETSWISVVRCAHVNRPATPLHMITDAHAESRQLAPEDQQKLGVKGIIEKSHSYAQMVELVAPLTLSFYARAALEQAQKNTSPFGVEPTAFDAAYLPIRAEDFVSGAKSFFDVYVRLSAGRYVKLLQSGDAFTVDRIESYIKKGVTHFYIRKEIQDVYLAYCDHLATSLMNQNNVPVEIKVSQTLNQGEQTLNHLKQNGVSEANIKYAENFASNLRELTRQLHKKENSILSSFMANVAAYEHGVGTAMLAGILANTLQIASENPLPVVGLSAMLHDIGLDQMPEFFRDEDESFMNPEQIKLYRTHPQVGAEALSKISGIPPAAIQAIQQHHMKLKGHGFPERTGGTPVTRIAEIVGICDDLNKWMQRCRNDASINIFAELELHVYPYFNQKLVHAFKSTFYPKQYTASV